VSNYTIFMDGCDLFSYLEVEDWAAAIEMLASSPVGQRWQALMAPLMNAEDPTMPWRPLEEAYHQD
jgi:L-rhamnose mutarotase